MAKRIETDWYYHFFDTTTTTTESKTNDFDNGYWYKSVRHTNVDALKGALQELSDYCNERLYEVKSMFPLTRSTSYEYAQTGGAVSNDTLSGISSAWGLGFGWGGN